MHPFVLSMPQQAFQSKTDRLTDRLLNRAQMRMVVVKSGRVAKFFVRASRALLHQIEPTFKKSCIHHCNYCITSKNSAPLIIQHANFQKAI